MAFFSPSEAQIKEIRKLVKDPISSGSSFIEFADVFSNSATAKELNIPQHILKANPQKQLFDVFWNVCDNLVNDRFRYTEGSCGKLIVGAKGIGKSTASRTFVSIIEAVHPEVIAIYIDFKRISSTLLEKQSLLPVLMSFLKKKRGLSFEEQDEFGDPVGPFFDELKIKNRYLFLIVDELDLLYKKPIEQIPHGHVILDDLVSFGTTKTGRMATMLCGSSVVLGDLIRGKSANETIRKNYPLVIGASNLNGSKYRTTRITSSLPIDIETVKISSRPFLENITLEKARCLTFVAGSTIRYVEHCIMDSEECDGESFLGADVVLYGFKDVDELADLFLKELMNALCEKNSALLYELHASKNLVHSISSIEWEKHFRPLEKPDVEKCWKDLKLKQKTIDSEITDCFFHLSDRSRIVLDGRSDDGIPKFVYPSTLFLLFKHQQEENRTHGVPKQLMEFAKDNISTVAKAVGKKSLGLGS